MVNCATGVGVRYHFNGFIRNSCIHLWASFCSFNRCFCLCSFYYRRFSFPSAIFCLLLLLLLVLHFAHFVNVSQSFIMLWQCRFIRCALYCDSTTFSDHNKAVIRDNAKALKRLGIRINMIFFPSSFRIYKYRSGGKVADRMRLKSIRFGQTRL